MARPRSQTKAETEELKSARAALEKEGIDGLDENIEELAKEKPEKVPGFPWFILCLAIFKDVMDGLDWTIVGIPVDYIFKFLSVAILTLWLYRKINGWFGIKKWLFRRYWRKIRNRWIATAILEMIPFLSIIPAETIFVLVAHYKEKRVAKLFNNFLEELQKSLTHIGWEKGAEFILEGELAPEITVGVALAKAYKKTYNDDEGSRFNGVVSNDDSYDYYDAA